MTAAVVSAAVVTSADVSVAAAVIFSEETSAFTVSTDVVSERTVISSETVVCSITVDVISPIFTAGAALSRFVATRAIIRQTITAPIAVKPAIIPFEAFGFPAFSLISADFAASDMSSALAWVCFVASTEGNLSVISSDFSLAEVFS